MGQVSNVHDASSSLRVLRAIRCIPEAMIEAILTIGSSGNGMKDAVSNIESFKSGKKSNDFSRKEKKRNRPRNAAYIWGSWTYVWSGAIGARLFDDLF